MITSPELLFLPAENSDRPLVLILHDTKTNFFDISLPLRYNHLTPPFIKNLLSAYTPIKKPMKRNLLQVRVVSSP